jgi:hypothetical protein
MSLYYYLLDDENKTYYELGSGSWYLLREDLDFLSIEELLNQYLIEEIFVEPYSEVSTEYIDKISKDIFNKFGKTNPKKLRIETHDCNERGTYLNLGSRYL